MKLKTAYRPKKPAENNNSPVEAVIAAPPIPEAPVAVAVETEPESKSEAESLAAQTDDASVALKRQLDAIRQNEELQRQQAVMIAAQRPMSREEKLALWKQQGMTGSESRFLEQNPTGIDFPQIVAAAAHEAMTAGHERDSALYWEAVQSNFDKHLARMQGEAEEPEEPEEVDSPAMEEAPPKFFQPPQKAPPPAAPSRGSIVSAPVSREVPSGGPRPDFETNPRHVTLSVEEQEIARASGISYQEYARQKIRLKRELASGQRQNG